MCTLAVYFHCSDELPVVVAANRDEFYDRPALPPARIADRPWVVAGQDLVARGTWLGVNAHGIVAGILNRRTRTLPDPSRRSRGLLCLEALAASTVEAAVAQICAQPGMRYNPFNLLVASPHVACVVGNVSGTMTATWLTPGLHLLTNLDLNDPECPRIAKSVAMFEAVRPRLRSARVEILLAELRQILSDHSTPLDPRDVGPPNNLCVHTERYGTRSSSLLLHDAGSNRFRMWHAAGPPCQEPHVEIDLPALVGPPPKISGRQGGKKGYPRGR